MKLKMNIIKKIEKIKSYKMMLHIIKKMLVLIFYNL
jgi:hypothetical protein